MTDFDKIRNIMICLEAGDYDKTKALNEIAKVCFHRELKIKSLNSNIKNKQKINYEPFFQNKHKIKYIIKSILAPMFFSFVPVLSHFIIGLYMMEQENTAGLGAIVFVIGIVCFFCWWFTSLYKIAQVNGLKRNQRLNKQKN